MLSNKECRRSWLLSLASKKPGEDMEEKSWRSFEETGALRFSKCAEILLMTASNAGYIAVSLP